MHIKKNDTVRVLLGEDRGKKGRVLAVHTRTNRLTVEGVQFIKRATRPNRRFPQGGLIEREAPIQMSNVMLICTKCNQPAKVKMVEASGKRYRTCHRCKEMIDE